MESSDRETARRRRKLWILATAAVLGLALVVPVSGAVLQRAFGTEQDGAQASEATSAAAPAPPTIAPLVVRSVISAEGVAPERCPQPVVGPAAPNPQLCDLDKTALFTLGDETIQLQLTGAEALLSPITKGHFVQVSMTPESARIFGDFTAAQVGKQIAFVRGGTVVSAPSIDQRIDGTSLQLSGELTEQQAEDIARLLRDRPDDNP